MNTGNAGALAPLASYLDDQADPKVLLDRRYRILAANKAYRHLFAGGAEVVGKHCFAVSHHFELPCDEAGESCPLRQAVETEVTQRVLHLHHTPSGEEHVDVEIAPVHDDEGGVCAYVESVRIVRHASTKLASARMVGRSRSFTQMLGLVMRVADAEATVLILGETGTGKELVAQAVHEHSQRVRGPFVAVDCSGLTETLFESELFGYEKGAFTGAHHRRIGLVESAAGGTGPLPGHLAACIAAVFAVAALAGLERGALFAARSGVPPCRSRVPDAQGGKVLLPVAETLRQHASTLQGTPPCEDDASARLHRARMPQLETERKRTLRQTCPRLQTEGAICVQRLDDSRNSAIHTTYRISLRSSSLWEPRHPLLKVV